MKKLSMATLMMKHGLCFPKEQNRRRGDTAASRSLGVDLGPAKITPGVEVVGSIDAGVLTEGYAVGAGRVIVLVDSGGVRAMSLSPWYSEVKCPRR